jgi:hypothetical protein
MALGGMKSGGKRGGTPPPSGDSEEGKGREDGIDAEVEVKK